MKVLILAAHSDDETIGVGGTIARHIKMGDNVYGKYFTDGLSSRSQSKRIDIIKREKTAISASKILGFEWLERGDFPDNMLDTVPLIEIIREIERVKNLIKPQIIYTHSPSDLNIDHRIIAEATVTAFRPKSNENFEEIRLYEVPSSTDYSHSSINQSFNPNLFINISKTWEIKLNALKEYDMEMNKAPNSRSINGIENLAMHRGFQSGVEYAEAFEVIRRIIR